jgi:hypothetical protein
MVAVYYYRSGVIATVTDEVPRNYFCAPEGTWHEHTKVKSNFVNTGWIVTGGGGGVAPMADQYTSVDNVTDAYTEFSGVTEEMIGDFTYSPDGYSFPRLPAGSVICPGGVDAAPTICPPGVWRAFFYDSGSTIVEKVKSLNTGAQPRTLYMIPFDTVDGCYVGAMTQTFSVGDIFENNYKGYNTYYEEFGCGYRKAIYETMNSTPYLHEKIGDNEETITWEVYAVTQNGIFPVDSGSVSRSWKDGEPKPPMPPLSAWGDMLATSDGQFPQYKFTMRFGVTTLGQYTAQPKEDMIHIGGHIAGDRFIGWA